MRSIYGGATIVLLAAAGPANAQEAGNTGSVPAPDAQPIASVARTGQVYTATDFTRYAPKNAYDMLSQVPGFTIRDSEQLRGLGQATGNVLFNGQRPAGKSDTLYTLLTRIPADNVERIEILDGATLDIPGLSGQVANIVYQADQFSGQFSFIAVLADPAAAFGKGNLDEIATRIQSEEPGDILKRIESGLT